MCCQILTKTSKVLGSSLQNTKAFAKRRFGDEDDALNQV
jgi:hypothetical protein